jgi:hypothetical protein
MCQVSPELTAGGDSPLAQRRSCGCCLNYEVGAICPYYPACKGSLDGGASWWVYSEKVERETLERITAMAGKEAT